MNEFLNQPLPPEVKLAPLLKELVPELNTESLNSGVRLAREVVVQQGEQLREVTEVVLPVADRVLEMVGVSWQQYLTKPAEIISGLTNLTPAQIEIFLRNTGESPVDPSLFLVGAATLLVGLLGAGLGSAVAYKRHPGFKKVVDEVYEGVKGLGLQARETLSDEINQGKSDREQIRRRKKRKNTATFIDDAPSVPGRNYKKVMALGVALSIGLCCFLCVGGSVTYARIPGVREFIDSRSPEITVEREPGSGSFLDPIFSPPTDEEIEEAERPPTQAERARTALEAYRTGDTSYDPTQIDQTTIVRNTAIGGPNWPMVETQLENLQDIFGRRFKEAYGREMVINDVRGMSDGVNDAAEFLTFLKDLDYDEAPVELRDPSGEVLWTGTVYDFYRLRSGAASPEGFLKSLNLQDLITLSAVPSGGVKKHLSLISRARDRDSLRKAVKRVLGLFKKPEEKSLAFSETPLNAVNKPKERSRPVEKIKPDKRGVFAERLLKAAESDGERMTKFGGQEWQSYAGRYFPEAQAFFRGGQARAAMIEVAEEWRPEIAGTLQIDENRLAEEVRQTILHSEPIGVQLSMETALITALILNLLARKTREFRRNRRRSSALPALANK